MADNIAYIHANKLAKPGRLYYAKNGFVYIGMANGRLERYTPVAKTEQETAQTTSPSTSTTTATTGVQTVTDDGNGVVVVDNTVPTDPVIQFAGVNVDGATVLGDGTAGNPLTAPGAAGFTYTVINVNFAMSPYTIVPTSGAVKYIVDATGGNITINYPTAVGNTALYTIIKTDASANLVTTVPNGAETINGYANMVLKFQNSSIDVWSDNSNLWIE